MANSKPTLKDNMKKVNWKLTPQLHLDDGKHYGVAVWLYFHRDVEEFIEKIKSKMWDEEKEMSKEIKGHDWANGYSSACHDFRTCIIDELSGFALKQEAEVKE